MRSNYRLSGRKSRRFRTIRSGEEKPSRVAVACQPQRETLLMSTPRGATVKVGTETGAGGRSAAVSLPRGAVSVTGLVHTKRADMEPQRAAACSPTW